MVFDKDKLENERLSVKQRLSEIQAELATHSISKNRKAFKADTISDSIIKRRAELTPELIILEKRLGEINSILKPKMSIDDRIWQDALYDVLTECFGESEIKKIKAETVRRISGLPPVRIDVNYGYNRHDKEEIKRLKKLCLELRELLLNARSGIDAYIRSQEPEVNKGEFLIKVKHINKSIPSKAEIEKIKIK